MRSCPGIRSDFAGSTDSVVACLRRDARCLGEGTEHALAQERRFRSGLLEVDAINQRRRQRTVDLVRAQAGGSLQDVPVCALGAAFKPDSDDIRDAPALDVARLLQDEGAIVRVYDPEAMDNARRAYPDLHYAGSVAEAAAGARVVALLTEWGQFRQIDPAWLGDIVEVRAIVDGRHALDPVAWRAADWDYRALGIS